MPDEPTPYLGGLRIVLCPGCGLEARVGGEAVAARCARCDAWLPVCSSSDSLLAAVSRGLPVTAEPVGASSSSDDQPTDRDDGDEEDEKPTARVASSDAHPAARRTSSSGTHAALGDTIRVPRRGAVHASGVIESDGSPERIGRYEVVSIIGRGGMGVVYKGRDPQLQRHVAIKMISDASWAGDAEGRARFIREARLTAKLVHRGIVPVYEVGQHVLRPYIVMAFIEGETFSAALKRGAVDTRRALEILREVATALHHAHTQGVVHRDLKPQNILIGPDGEPRVTDFGLARDTGTQNRLTITGNAIGTPSYMAPEQAAGDVDQQGPRTDVWALGALLYRVLAGRAPFEGDRPLAVIQQVLTEDPIAPRQLDPSIPSDLETIALRCLARKPRQRYPTAAMVADELGRYLRGEPIVARAAGRAERAWQTVRRRPTGVLAAGLGVALVAMVIAAPLMRASERASAQAALLAQKTLEAERRRAELDEHLARPLPPLDEPDRRRLHGERTIDLGLLALEASHFRLALARSHGDRAARAAAEQAALGVALAFADAARALERWEVAAAVLRGVSDLGIDDARARRALAGLQGARAIEARASRERIRPIVDRIAVGELRADDALFEIARLHDDAATVAFLAERLGEIADELREVGDSVRRERERTGEEGTPLLAATAAAQTESIGARRLALARVCCEALGRLGEGEAAVAVLGRYLEHEADADRARVAVDALRRLGGPEAETHVASAVERFGEQLRRPVELDRETPERPADAPAPASAGATDESLARAYELYQAGELDAATEELERVIAQQPDNALAYLQRSYVRGARRDVVAAVADVVRASELASRQRKGLILQMTAQARTMLGDYKGAIADLTRVIELEPNGADAYAERGMYRLADGDAAGSMADCARALELDPVNLTALMSRSRARHALGDAEGALRDATAATQADPSSASVWYNRGLIGSELALWERAVADFDRAIELEPDEARYLFERGYARLYAEQLEGALADLSRAHELEPRRSEYLRFRGIVRRKLGDFQGSLADLGDAIELGPGRHVLYVARAETYYDLERYAEALADVDRALALERDSRSAVLLDAQIRWQLGEHEAAIAACDRAVELAPTASALAARGFMLVSIGRAADAITDFDRVIDSADSAAARLGRAFGRILRDDEAGAIADLKAAISIEKKPRVMTRIYLALLTGDDAQVRERTSADDWEASLARAFLGELDEKALLAEAESADRPLEGRRRAARALAVLGVARERAGDRPGAIGYYERCRAMNVADEAGTNWSMARLRLWRGE